MEARKEARTPAELPRLGTGTRQAQTAAEARKAGLPSQVADNVQAAIKAIVAQAPNARILICGSLYLAGHVMRENDA